MPVAKKKAPAKKKKAPTRAKAKRRTLAGTPKTRTKKVGAAKRNPNWKPSAKQLKALSPAMIAGLRRYHKGN